jgi:hypothetical protein
MGDTISGRAARAIVAVLPEFEKKLMGCLHGDVGATTGLPRIADDLLQYASRQRRANYGSRGAFHAPRKLV